MTLDEFLSWDPDDPTGVPWQLIDGEPVAMAPGSAAHGEIQAELVALLRNHLLGREPCRVVTEPGIVPRARADINYRVPDLAVTGEPPSRDQMIHQPVVLVEIVSPSNEVETNANIWAFTTIPSVMEILSIHSTRIAASLLRRGSDGSWPADPIAVGPDGILVLDSIGFGAPLRGATGPLSYLGGEEGTQGDPILQRFKAALNAQYGDPIERVVLRPRGDGHEQPRDGYRINMLAEIGWQVPRRSRTHRQLVVPAAAEALP